MFNHLEYDAGTLRDEYKRDIGQGKPIGLPENYFPRDDPGLIPTNNWHAYGRLFFANWLTQDAAVS